MQLTLSHIAQKIDATLIGDQDIEIHSICSNNYIDNSNIKDKNSIVFISKYDTDTECFSNSTTFLLNSKTHKSFINAEKFNFLISKEPKLSFALLTNLFKENVSAPKSKIFHPNTNKLLVGKNVSIGLNFIYGSNCVIEDNVSIGNDVKIENNVIIHHGTSIGSNVTIRSGSIIGSEGFGNIQDNEQSWCHVAHLGNVILKNDIDIGSNCCIDRATLESTIINSGVIIDNLVHIAHNVVIGEKTAIAAKVGIAGSCIIGKRNMIGGMVGIVDHIKTADDVIISATSTVNKDIKEPGIYTGIMPLVKHYRWKRIALWITKLDKIAKFLNLKRSKL